MEKTLREADQVSFRGAVSAIAPTLPSTPIS
jgi:hypothetical protein